MVYVVSDNAIRFSLLITSRKTCSKHTQKDWEGRGCREVKELGKFNTNETTKGKWNL